MAIPAPIPGAAKNASPLPIVPKSPPPMAATMAPTAAYLAYRISLLMAYLIIYLRVRPIIVIYLVGVALIAILSSLL